MTDTQYALGASRITDPRAALVTALDKAFDHCTKHNSLGAILAISIDDLAMIMSCYTNDVIDGILIHLKKLITEAVGNQGTVVHPKYDQFAVILHNTDEAKTAALAESIYTIAKLLGCSQDISTPIFLTTSIGSVHFPDELTKTSREAIDHTYIAIHQAKTARGTFYGTFRKGKEYADGIKDKMQKASYLQNAIKDDRLRLAFQPIISSTDGSTFCYECLLRAVEPNGEILSVGQYIPIAEEMDFIDEIDHVVLQKVVTELEQDPTVRLGFNISNQAIDSPSWFKKAEKLLRDPAIASRVIVEITETGMQKDLNRMSYFVASLQGLGCQVALDDFGAGYTSFKQLKALPIDIVKIDGSFVKDILDNYDSQLFVKTLLDFTNSFGLRTIAEYVENGEIAKSLMDLKVSYLQGHYFSPAVNHRPWLKG